MDLITFSDAYQFLGKTQLWLEETEAKNSLMLGLAFRLMRAPELFKTQPFLGCVVDAGDLKVAAVMTPPHNLVLAGHPDEEAFQTLAGGLIEQNWSVPGIVGPDQVSNVFAKVWGRAAGISPIPRLHMRLYQLDQVVPTAPVPGSLRNARSEDVPLLTDWVSSFQKEALNESVSREEACRHAELRVSEQDLFLWDNQQPVCMAASARPTRNGTSVNLVYTPPEHRRKGYASACVAALSQRLLDSGYQFCCLFTDLSNPTSNRIYMNLGYQPVCDYEEHSFRKAAADPSPVNTG